MPKEAGLPDFTQPHGISSPRPEEFVKDATFDAKLANDIRATALSVDLAITAEGLRAEAAAAFDATSKANAAKTAAINAASADATTKANTAQSEAAIDATAKAEGARSSAVKESKTYTDQVVDTSHLARDVDGTPYFSFGSMTLSVHMDTDGNPFFLDA